MMTSPTWGQYQGGTGSAQDPYLLSSFDQLKFLAETPSDWDKSFELINDIEWDPNVAGLRVGTSSAHFTGSLNGRGYVVRGFTFDHRYERCVGLFGYVGSSASIRKLGVVDVNIVADDYVGALVGYNHGTVLYCFAGGQLAGDDYVGGLVGSNNGMVSRCFAHVDVSGDYGVGGLIGQSSGFANECYAIGGHSVKGHIGGLIGARWGSGSVIKCFWDTQTSGTDHSKGGTGKTTEQMQQIDTFQEAGWDFAGAADDGFDDIWVMPGDNRYPILWWQTDIVRHQPTFSGGDGSEDDPYWITCPNDLRKIASRSILLDKCFKLTDDLDLQDIPFSPIGGPFESFRGIFDGNGYTIRMLTLSNTLPQNVGLFSVIGAGGFVQNLILEDALVEGNTNVAILAGLNRGSIMNCHCTGIVYGLSKAGALVGTNNGRISQCSSTADIVGDECIGGLVGGNHGSVSLSCAAGLVVGDDYAGGLVGYNNAGLLTNCYATATIAGRHIGALVGYNDGAMVISCLAGGNLLGQYNVGGLIGYARSSIYNVIQGSFWDIQETRQTTSSGGMGLTRDEMTRIEIFQTYDWDIAPAAFATDQIWIMPDGGAYPVLSWHQGEVPSAHVFSGGTGVEHDPYLIATVDDLLVLGQTPSLMDKSFRLICDLDLQGIDVKMIGTGGIPFVGTFDGDNHSLANLAIDANDMSMVGLFAFIGSNGTVRNLGLHDVRIKGHTCIGGIAGINQGTIESCFVTGQLSGDRAIGGIAGWNAGMITLSISVVELEGTEGLGELAGVTGSPEMRMHPSTGRR